MKKIVLVLVSCLMLCGNAFAEAVETPSPLKKKDYKRIKYEDLARSVTYYEGEAIRYTGWVTIFNTDGPDATFVLVLKKSDPFNPIYCEVEGFQNWVFDDGRALERLLPYDKVTIYGHVEGETIIETDVRNFHMPIISVDLLDIYD